MNISPKKFVALPLAALALALSLPTLSSSTATADTASTSLVGTQDTSLMRSRIVWLF